MSTSDTTTTTPKTAAPHQYFLTSWVRNYSDDWDNMLSYWDDELGEVKEWTAQSTRFGNDPTCRFVATVHKEIPPEVQERIVAHFSERVAKGFLSDNEELRMRPPSEVLTRGTSVRFLKKGTRGTNLYEAGEEGRIFWTGHHGTFYRNGYNKRSRSNGRIGVEVTGSDGASRRVFAPMTSVGLVLPEMSQKEAEMRGFLRAVQIYREYEVSTRSPVCPALIAREFATRRSLQRFYAAAPEITQPEEEQSLPTEDPALVAEMKREADINAPGHS